MDDITTDDNISEEDIEVKVEDEADDSAGTEVHSEEEETSQKNKPLKQESREGKRSAGEVIANLGNEKKRIASSLVSLAKSNEQARKQVQEMLLKDPSTATYIKSKFGEDYDFIVGDESAGEGVVDRDRIREEERAKAEAEVLKSQMQINHDKMLEEKAREYGFNVDELEVFRKKVELLGGDEKAMEDAALVVNYRKATAKTGETIAAGGEAEKPKRQVTITSGLNDFSESMGIDRKEFASGISKVKGLHRKDALGGTVMDLPKL
jgi:hypothetical protein